MSVVDDWRDRLCGRLVGGARLGLQTVLQAAMKAPSGVPANESADLFMNRWVF